MQSFQSQTDLFVLFIQIGEVWLQDWLQDWLRPTTQRETLKKFNGKLNSFYWEDQKSMKMGNTKRY